MRIEVRYGSPVTHTTSAARWLKLSMVAACLALAGSAVSLSVDGWYDGEAPAWAAQAVGQDIGDIAVYLAMIALAALALRGSVRSYLAWLGTVAFSAYSFAIFVFDIQFNRMFLLYVAVFGLSVFCLIGGLGSLDPARVAQQVGHRYARPAAFASIGIAAVFVILWLGELIPATVAGRPPAALVDTGLATNPVHAIDLAIFLPTALAAGVMALRRRAMGYVLLPVVLTAMAALGATILVSMAVAASRGLDAPPPVAAMVGAITVLEISAVLWFMRGIARYAGVHHVERESGRS